VKWTGGIVALVIVLILALSLAAYEARDYRAAFSRAAGELIAVRDSTTFASSDRATRITEVTLVSDTGMEVRVRIRAPASGDAERRPAILLLGGLRTGRRAIDIPTGANDLIMAGIDYPYDGPKRPRGWWAWLRHMPAMRRSIIETPSALLLAAQYLYTRGDVDPNRVSILGVSLGVPFAVATAATDHRIAGAAYFHWGGGNQCMIHHAVGEKNGRLVTTLVTRVVTFLIAPLEPTRYAGAVAPRPTLLVNATRDESVPRGCVENLFRATGHPKRLVWLDTEHVGTTEIEVVNGLLDEMLAWMEEQGLR
jgi:hypothetical protein